MNKWQIRIETKIKFGPFSSEKMSVGKICSVYRVYVSKINQLGIMVSIKTKEILAKICQKFSKLIALK